MQPSQGLGNGFGVGGAGSMKALQHRLLKPQASSDAAAWHPHEAQTAAPLLRWRQATLTVLPALPALQLVLTRRERRGEDEVLAAAPLPEEPRAEPPPTPSGAGAAATAGSGATPSLATTSSSSTAGAGGSAAPGLKRSSSMTSTSSSLAAAAAAAAASSAPAAAGKLAQAAALASAASRRAVAVWHGQRCSWDLHLTNNGASTITSAHISIANSRGVLLKPLPQGCVRASFAGVHLQPCRKGAASLAAAMPLAPGATAVVPIDVHVGQPLGDAYEEVVLEVCGGWRRLLEDSSGVGSLPRERPRQQCSSARSARVIKARALTQGSSQCLCAPAHVAAAKLACTAAGLLHQAAWL